MIKYITALVAASALFLTSCTNVGSVQQFLGSPAAVQSDLIILGGIAKPHITASAQVQIHQFAVAVSQAADLDLNQLYALLPASTGSANGDAFVSAAKTALGLAVAKFGAHNQTAIAYAKAVANGLLANF